MCKRRKIDKLKQYASRELKQLRKQAVAGFVVVLVSFAIIFFVKFKGGEPPSWLDYLSADVVFTLVSALLSLMLTRWITNTYNAIVLEIISCILFLSLYVLTLRDQTKWLAIFTGVAILWYSIVLIFDTAILRKIIIKRKAEELSKAAAEDNMSVNRGERK